MKPRNGTIEIVDEAYTDNLGYVSCYSRYCVMVQVYGNVIFQYNYETLSEAIDKSQLIVDI